MKFVVSRRKYIYILLNKFAAVSPWAQMSVSSEEETELKRHTITGSHLASRLVNIS